MSKTETGKVSLRERIAAMSKPENVESIRALRGEELDVVSGGSSVWYFRSLPISS
jgi:hypothetical protein